LPENETPFVGVSFFGGRREPSRGEGSLPGAKEAFPEVFYNSLLGNEFFLLIFIFDKF
jgi:hypothetical protein